MLKKLFRIFFLLIGSQLFSSDGVYDSAYSEMAVIQPRMVIQLQFPYNINTDYVGTTLVGTGTVTQSSNMAVLQTGTGSTGSALLQSIDRLNHRVAQGSTVLFTAVFTAGVANSVQQIGVGGFNTTPSIKDGFFFGYNGTTFGIFWYNNSTTPTFIAQSTWNGDPFDGTGISGVTLVPTNGNVYKIQMQALGFGVIKFYIENPSTGVPVLVHTIQYPNTATTVNLGNGTMQLVAFATNSGNTTNITLRTSSMVALIEGLLHRYTDNRNSIFNTVAITTVLTPALTNIITIQNKSTYQGVANQVMVYPDFVTIMNTTANNNPYIIRMVLNPTVGGVPSFTDISTNTSVVSFDTAGTTVTGGTLLATFFCAGNVAPISRSFLIDVKDMGLNLKPGDRLVFAGLVPTAASAITGYVGVTWRERL